MTNMERRNFIQSAGLLAGAAAATTLIDQSAHRAERATDGSQSQ